MKYQIKLFRHTSVYYTTDIKDLVFTISNNSRKDIILISISVLKKDISKAKPSRWLTSGYYE